MQVFFPKCSTEVRDALVAEYVIDDIRDEEKRVATVFIDTKYLKASHFSTIKFETSRHTSIFTKSVRTSILEADAPKEIAEYPMH
ncbi:hypothetical protein NPIL_105601 [Nephila pilipes]|uniref:Uncharacterized protein n=1 Tax=Nephila pilipes TaxID=299642 RepID=A0A8X6NI01_NEPPI|nr:hypothetical protein NPIL_105601 [Nephila pilipes]